MSKIKSFDEDKSLIVLKNDSKFDSICGQVNSFKKQVIPMIENCLNGCNCTLFVYRHSAINKTCTIIDDINSKGIISNTFQYLFDRMNQLHKNRKFTVSISYLEICNGESNNLSTSESNRKITIPERSDVTNLEHFFIDSLKVINSERHVRKSHTICTISIASVRNNIRIFSKLNLVNVVGEWNNANYTESLKQEINKLETKISTLSLQENNVKINDGRRVSKIQDEFKTIEIETNNLKEKILIVKHQLFKKEQQNFDRYFRRLECKWRRKNQERLKIKENCLSLQNENEMITRQIDEIEKDLDEIQRKSLYNYHEHQRDIDNLKMRNRFLLRKLQLASMIINYYIPDKYLPMIIMDNFGSNNFHNKDYYRLNNCRLIRNKLNEISPKQSTKLIKTDGQSAYKKYSKTKEDNCNDEMF